MPLDDLGAADLEIPDPRLHARNQELVQPDAQTHNQPDHQPKDECRDGRDTQRREQQVQIPRFAIFGNDQFQLTRSLAGRCLHIVLPQGIDVAGRHHESQPLIDHQQLPLRVVLDGHGELATLVQRFIDRKTRPVDTRLGRCPQQTGSKHHHGPVEHDQRGRIARWLGIGGFR